MPVEPFAYCGNVHKLDVSKEGYRNKKQGEKMEARRVGEERPMKQLNRRGTESEQDVVHQSGETSVDSGAVDS